MSRRHVAFGPRYPLVALVAFALWAPVVHAQVEGQPRPLVSVAGGAPGDPVELTMSSGLGPGSRASLGFGGLSGGYELIGRVEADASGAVTATVNIPDWVEPNLVYYFFVNVGGGVRLFSDPFIATSPDGSLSVRGYVSEVTDGCIVMSGLDETRYALLEATDPVEVGALVRVDGHLAPRGVPREGSPCAEGPSIPVRVARIQVG